ncbi:MAG: lipoyl(octanoyl) transferase LipB [Negativicutes bacterium]
MKLIVSRLNRLEYGKGLDLQNHILKLRQQGVIPDMLLILEHTPVITIGRSGSEAHILATQNKLDEKGVAVYHTNRGGDVTYHGPGQLVGYPVLDLREHGKDISIYLHRIEEIFIRLLYREYGINARRDKQYPGVWIENEKITAIGCAVKKWVSMHGFAFNVNTGLDAFQWIVPCGIAHRGVTSLQQVLGKPLNMGILQQSVIGYFAEIFDMEPEMVEQESLYNRIGWKK